MAGGLGKTMTAIFDVEQYLDEHPNARILYLCDQETILLQNKQKFRDYFGEERSCGLYSGTSKTLHRVDFLFATLQSVRDHREDFIANGYDYIIVDEAHHTSADTYEPVIKLFRPQFLIGLTATPDREDGRNILDIYRQILFEMDIYQGWAEGWLTRARYELMLDDVDEKRLKAYLDPKNVGSKISIAQLNRTIFAPQRDEEIVASARERIASAGIKDPRIFAFCSNIAYAESMAKHFGDGAAVVHSGQSRALNEAILTDFRSGKLNTVIAVDMLNEGVDVPEANVLIFLRSTDTKRIFFQQLARGLRLSDGKDFALVLDYVCSIERIADVLEMEKTSQERCRSVPLYPSAARRPSPITVNIPATKFRVQRVDIERLFARAATPKQWSEEELLRLFSQKAMELGHPPRAFDLLNDPDMPSQHIYLAHFGTLANVASLCNLIPNRDRYANCSDEELLEKIRNKAVDGVMPSNHDLISDPDMPHPGVYHKRFGAWGNIAKLTGLQMTRSQKGFFDKKGRDELIAILQDESKKLGKTPSISDFRSNPNLPSVDAFKAVFGSWNAAIEAAGLSVNQGHKIGDEDLLEALRRKASLLGHTPTRKEVDNDKDMLSSVSYANRFGTFRRALELAGLAYGNRSGWKRDTKDQEELDRSMLKKLRALLDMLGRDPTRIEVDQAKDLASSTTYVRHFGSFSNAVNLAKNLENN